LLVEGQEMIQIEEGAEFTGERLVPGKAGRRVEADHLERYRFACQYARNRKVLDIACGSGYGAPLLIEASASQYVGMDINENCVRYAKRRYESKHSIFLVGDICSLEAQERYDLIICFETIEHIESYHIALSNLFSALTPGGFLLISSPNRPITSPKALLLSDKPANIFHTQEFTPGELLNELHAAGFKTDLKYLFGQRQRWLYDNKHIQSLIRLVRFPDVFAYITSPKVKPVINMAPRYFVIVARKNLKA
jgi:SAM-dependent methyltransferase